MRHDTISLNPSSAGISSQQSSVALFAVFTVPRKQKREEILTAHLKSRVFPPTWRLQLCQKSATTWRKCYLNPSGNENEAFRERERESAEIRKSLFNRFCQKKQQENISVSHKRFIVSVQFSRKRLLKYQNALVRVLKWPPLSEKNYGWVIKNQLNVNPPPPPRGPFAAITPNMVMANIWCQ